MTSFGALLRLVLRLYPSDFRRVFGDEWRRFVLEQRREPRYRLAVVGPALFWKDVLVDALVAGARMRWRDGALAGRAKRTVKRASAAGRGRLASPGGPAYGSDLRDDLGYALRSLRRRPGFSVVTVATLALALAATAATLSVVEAVLLRPLPYEDPDRVVLLSEDSPGDNVRWLVSAANFRDWRERSRSFTEVAAVNRMIGGWADLSGSDEPLEVPLAQVTSDLFDLLGTEPMLGRRILPEDDAPGSEPTVVLSHAIWVEAFGRDPGVLGRSIRLDDRAHTVVGVMPPGFGVGVVDLPRVLWLAGGIPPRARDDRRQRMFRVVGRLAPGVTLEQADAELADLAAALAVEYPEANQDDGRPWGANVVTIREALIEYTIRPSVRVLAGAVGIMLLVALLNGANLLGARTEARRREIAIRCAIGAGRGRVTRQFVTEAFLVVLLALGVGLLAARRLGLLFGAVVVGSQPFAFDTSVTLWAASMTAVLALVAGSILGATSSARAVRTAAGDRLGTHLSRAPRGRAFAQLVVAAQISFAMVLLVGMGLMVDTMRRISGVPLGFDPHGVEVLDAALRTQDYTAPTEDGRRVIRPEWEAFLDRTLARIESLDGVEIAAASTGIPIRGGGQIVPVHFVGLDREPDPRFPRPAGVDIHEYLSVRTITASYFDAIGTDVVQGRGFGPADDGSVPPVAVVNRALVEEFGLDEPIGRSLMVQDGAEWRTAEIVGIVENTLLRYPRYGWVARYTGFGPIVYLHAAQPAASYTPRGAGAAISVTLVARHEGDGETIRGAMRDVFREADERSPILLQGSMDELVSGDTDDRRMLLRLIVSLALISVVLALGGVYGVVAFQVSRRVHEIGVRMVLGARRTGVVGMILGDGFRVGLLGALVGVGGALATSRFLVRWLYEVSPTDPAVFAGAATSMVAVTLLACWVPARRAAQVDPMESLRAE